MAIVLARQLNDGWTGVTPDSPVPMGACLVAQRMHAPSLTFWSAMLGLNPEPDRLYPTSLDARYLASVEAIGDFYDVFEYSETGCDFMFASGMQIDRHGNANNVRVGGPGTGRPLTVGQGQANASHPVVDSHIFLYSVRHAPDVFVEQVDFVSIAGHLDGVGARARAKLPGGGPVSCVTPLALMDFDDGKALRLASLHPGVTVEDLRAQTGFHVPASHPPAQTRTPSEAELATLRALDRDGVLRR
jgi:glutaconate CoA-transferase, subunit B